MNFFKDALNACLISGCMLLPLAHADTTIVIVRHGEKPALGLGQLSCQGLNRSLALPPVLLAHYGRPVAIYASNPSIKKNDQGVQYAYIRPLATIEPLAISSGLPVNIDWGMSDITPLAKVLLARNQGTQVVAWEHHFADKLARQLLALSGGNPHEVPDWNNKDYDSIYVVQVSEHDKKRHATFTLESEGLNDLPTTCKN